MQESKPTKTDPISDATTAVLRRAISADAAAVQELTRKAYAKWIPVIGREPMPMTADYGVAVREHLVDLLYVGAQLAALIETIPKTDHLLIENVAVSPSLQGRGLGRRLMAHAEALASHSGFPRCGFTRTRISRLTFGFISGSVTRWIVRCPSWVAPPSICASRS